MADEKDASTAQPMSMADQNEHSAPHPVSDSAPSKAPSKKRVLIAVDESKESMSALKWALKNVLQGADKLHLLHAQPLPTVYGPGIAVAGSDLDAGIYTPPGLLDTVRKQQETVSMQVLRTAKVMSKEFQVDAETDVIVGDPRDSICAAVEELKPDLLVIGAHGYGAIKRAFLGSVSDYCVHHAKCPVLVVRNVE